MDAVIPKKMSWFSYCSYGECEGILWRVRRRTTWLSIDWLCLPARPGRKELNEERKVMSKKIYLWFASDKVSAVWNTSTIITHDWKKRDMGEMKEMGEDKLFIIAGTAGRWATALGNRDLAIVRLGPELLCCTSRANSAMHIANSLIPAHIFTCKQRHAAGIVSYGSYHSAPGWDSASQPPFLCSYPPQVFWCNVLAFDIYVP